MCYYVDVKTTPSEVKKIFNVGINHADQFKTGEFISGFTHPNLPVITNLQPDLIQTDFTWGLQPSWGKGKDLELRKGKLNARLEEIDQKVSYKNITSNRCLILSTSYWEWRWLDEKGKQKEKYTIFSQNDEIFGFAGMYDSWLNPVNGEIMRTFTMVTTAANELMRYIHNHKKRMPIIINRADQQSWLDPKIDIQEFAYPNYNQSLVAFVAA
ncbi:SOS response-associated peptidase [Flavobacterium sp. FlaQc-48]|uniref:SOS response-associated peptidase n=1 Tax=Flavobacterium sp. FlaQc-48 TaxID=3374181 RepID=UPI003758140A